MAFYTSIAPYYDDIFPLSQGQKKLVESCSINRPAHSVLDVGCATGELALYLSDKAREVCAIDLDPELIAIAKAKVDALGIENVLLFVADMVQVKDYFPAGRFQYAFCLGNTLVHLNTPARVADFLRSLAEVLAPGGQFIFQILNYERIISRNIRELPLIDNERIAFERRYAPRADGRLDFMTRLKVKQSGVVIENSIPLYPLRMGELKTILEKSSFEPLEWLGSFDGTAYSEESDLLIGVLEKKDR